MLTRTSGLGSRTRLAGSLAVMVGAGALVKAGSAVSVGLIALLFAVTALGLVLALVSHRRRVAVAGYVLVTMSLGCEAYRELNAARLGVGTSLAVAGGMLLFAGACCLVVDVLMSRKQIRLGHHGT